MPQLRALVLTLLAGLLATVGLAVTPSAASAADDGDVAWAVRTADNQYGDGRQNYGYTLNPGGRLKDAMVVVNHGTAPLTLAISAADGFTTQDGQVDLLTDDRESTGVGAWVRPARSSVTIPPGGSVKVPFTLTLPDNATPGDHLGGIITSLRQESEVAGISSVDRRLAMSIRLRVGGDLTPGLSVEDLRLVRDGTATVEYTVRNTGNAILTAQQSVSVSGPFGLLGQTADVADTPALLPGETWEVSVPVDGVRAAGRLAATVHLTPLLTDASGSTSTLPQVDATTHTWAVPWLLALLVLLLAAAAAAYVVLRRRRRDQARQREDERVADAVAAALRDREKSDA